VVFYLTDLIEFLACTHLFIVIRRAADKSLAFPICSITKKKFLDGLKKIEQRSHKCVELRGEYVE
jgi:hypothetical protein